MPFEKYLPPRRQKTTEVAIRATGTISMARAFAVQYGLAAVGFVTLHFDKDKKLVGVKSATDPREEGAVRIFHRKRVSSIRARSFFDHYRIPLVGTIRCRIDFDAALGMGVISLGDIRRLPGRRRKQL